MSIIVEDFAPLLTPDPEIVERRKRVRPYKPRVSTKVRWALGDAMERTLNAQIRLRRVLEWLEETHRFDIDDHARAHLGKLEIELLGLALDVTELERILVAAKAHCRATK